MKKITLRQLRKAGVCKEVRQEFRHLFGRSVEVTLEKALAHADDFSWSTAAEYLLSRGMVIEYYREENTHHDIYNKNHAAVEGTSLNLEYYLAASAAMRTILNQAKARSFVLHYLAS